LRAFDPKMEALGLAVHLRKGKEEMEKLLLGGYQAAAKESLTLTKEFENADLEGWDDY